MKLDHIRIKRAMRGEDAGAWARALEDPRWLEGSKVLKDEPGSSWVRRATINGRDVVVKCRLLNTPSRRLKSALGFGHGDKHWRGAARLAGKQIATARPVVLGHGHIGGVPAEMVVLEFVPGRTLLEVIAGAGRSRSTVKSEHALAAEVGAQVGRLTLGGHYNRDHKPSNLIVVDHGNGRETAAIIDAVAIRMCGEGGLREMERMLASLVIEPMGCGVAPRRTLMMRTLHGAVGEWPHEMKREFRRRWVRGLWARVQQRVAAHGDPRPRINPLSDRGIGFQPMSARRAER